MPLDHHDFKEMTNLAKSNVVFPPVYITPGILTLKMEFDSSGNLL